MSKKIEFDKMKDITITMIDGDTVHYKLTHSRHFADKNGDKDLFHRMIVSKGWDGYKEFVLGSIKVGKRYYIDQLTEWVRGYRVIHWLAITPLNRASKPEHNKQRVWGDKDEDSYDGDLLTF